MPDGILVIDKPPGPTSHDVVAVARRALKERRIGHTGTLDPIATGVLPLACGRVTRLVRFLTASDKEYEAQIRFGIATDTYDVTGRQVAGVDRALSVEEVSAALVGLTGEYEQAPPPYSAKKLGGRRAYELARADVAVQPEPVWVRVERLELIELADRSATVRLTCSAGFYVRSLAHELGVRLGTGACLAALRRTRSGEFGLDRSIALDVLTTDPAAVERALIPSAALLPQFPTIELTEEGLRWVSHGREVRAAQVRGALPEGAEWVRLIDSSSGTLVALAEPRGDGSLHPSVVLI